MNYDEIKAAVLSFIDRENDTELDAQYDTLLRMVEARVNRRMRVSDMVNRAVTSTLEDQEYYSLPADFAAVRDIEIRDSVTSTQRTTLKYLNPEMVNSISGQRGSVSGIYYTLIARQLHIMPPQADKVLEIIYYRRIPPLTETDNTNWISENSPDIYISGLLVAANAFVSNAEAVNIWDAAFLSEIDVAKDKDQSDRWSGTSLEIRRG